MTPQVAKFVREINQRLPAYGSVQGASEDLRSFMQDVMGPLSAENEANLAEAMRLVEASLQSVEILRRNSLVKVRQDWYSGPSSVDPHWAALKGYLLNEKGWGEDSVRSIDEASTEVVSLLANPGEGQFRCRGLVVGYVQSGKTANMTGVIAKAVDAGYNLIVIFGGVTNKLRAQTQRRLQSDIVDRHRHLWQLYTTPADDGDFIRPPNNGQFTMPVPGRAQLVVMKKEGTRLKAFLDAVEHTPATVLRSLKTLIIDDECDQASVNAGRKEYDITEINRAIRKIIRALPAVSYVGYTATPFANVFINPFPVSKDELDDLYPEDFITALERPEGYFGAREVFGFDPDDADRDEGQSAGRDMVRAIPAKEVALLRSVHSSKTFQPKVTPALERALIWFLLTCALRRRRGHGTSHMTMLVHTSQLVAQHENMAVEIRAWLSQNSDALSAGHGAIWQTAVDVWEDETSRVRPERTETVSVIDLLPLLVEAIQALEVVVENGVSDKRLDYTGAPKTYIVVGGSVLARGLTLEGLCVSFFLRTSKQYDTLLQMGRWFGFRHGYADLPRLWSTQDLIANFRALAHIEEEIRQDISEYKLRKATPQEFAVKVRAIPGLAITSAAKMRYARKTSISFEGKHIQTIRFDHLKDGIVLDNWAAAAHLVDAAHAKGIYEEGRGVFKDVPIEAVRQFLNSYDICRAHLDLKREMLLNYLDVAADKLSKWNVAVVSPREGVLSSKPLGFLGAVHTSVRSRLAEPSEYADVKALMSKRDILVDVDDRQMQKGEEWRALKSRRPDKPLLLIYPIEARSEPKNGGKARVALGAVDDLIGFGIVFPGELDRAGAYWAVELDVPTPEQLEDDGELEEELVDV
ncbi:endonuclease [Luteimonas chenhongjianii]|uniref:Endonuclease n=2 Tax=Luteimonas chenhongjianii TaxID=2006110 RepID=A0A290XI30_9GAMM|nr:endonuclease [Luteimonas chenhongjianii]